MDKGNQLKLEEMIAFQDAEIDDSIRKGYVDKALECEIFGYDEDEEDSEEFWDEEEEKKGWKAKKEYRRTHAHATLKKDNYDDLNLYSDDMILLAKIEMRKFSWYLKKGLAEQINEKSIKLKFRPKGYGHNNDMFYLSKIDNICVACGSDKDLTRHHIVSFEYRKHMPEFVRSHSSHDVCLLCAFCHERYETEAVKLRKEISEKYNAPLGGVGIIKKIECASAKKAANALYQHRQKLPPNRVKELEHELRLFISLWKQDENSSTNNAEGDDENDEFEITNDQLRTILDLHVTDKTDFISHGELTITAMKQQSLNEEDYLDKLDSFCRMWRQHFIDILNPKYMNKYWQVDKKIKRSHNDDPNKISQ